ncbi:MAG: hypothetical protein U0941_19370 [Planctomycetaceae bacterium]
MTLDKDILLAEWNRCAVEWQPLQNTWSRELRALCLAGLVEVQATTVVETTSAQFPETVTFVIVQSGFVTEYTRDKYLPSEWFDDQGRHLVKANERVLSLDAMKLTGYGAALANSIADGKLDLQVDLIQFVEGVSEETPGCLSVAMARASCAVVHHKINRQSIKPSSDDDGGDQDPWLGPYRSQIVRRCFDIAEKGWTSFANGYRSQGKIENCCGSNGKPTPKLVKVRRSVFTERGVKPPE